MARDPAGTPTPLPGRPVRNSETGRPIMALLDLLGRRWTLRIIWELAQAPGPTFRELQRRCDGISSSVLTQRLTELTEAGIVHREERGYALTPDGQELGEELMRLNHWADGWATRVQNDRAGQA
jgi:DNA-binding HxlR family transcriptional regulator